MVNEFIRNINQWATHYWAIVAVLWIAQFIVYNYLFTHVTFSNHTLPNSWLTPYPGYRTHGEGRWLADLIILFQGGLGVQAFQMFIASFLQAINGILFAMFLGYRNKLIVFIISALICFYPAFLDYYGFSIDHICFVLGDTLCLIAALHSASQEHIRNRILISSLLYTLALSIYGPKIALVAFFVGATSISRLAQGNIERMQVDSIPEWLQEVFVMLTTLFVSVFAFWISTKITISYDIGLRTQLNGVPEMLKELGKAYPFMIDFVASGIGGVPSRLAILPIIGIVLGITSILTRSIPFGSKLTCLAITLAMPLAIHLPWIINSSAWRGVGRLYPANGYFLIFFLSWGLRMRLSRYVSILIMTLMLYFWIVLGTQQSNAIMFKSIYETNFINRIIARLDLCSDSSQSAPQPLVVVGDIPPLDLSKFIRYPASEKPHQLLSSTFAPYRQTEILNFFSGKDTYSRPSKQERRLALANLTSMKPWPDNSSIACKNGTSIVYLHYISAEDLLSDEEPFSANLTWLNNE